MATQLDVSLKDYPSAQEYNDFYNKMAGIVVNITAWALCKNGELVEVTGGGVVIHENGVILSITGGFRNFQQAEVKFYDKRQYRATVFYWDNKKDLMLLSIDTKGTKLDYGLLYRKCARGQPVIVIGSMRRKYIMCFGKISDPYLSHGDLRGLKGKSTGYKLIEVHGADWVSDIYGAPLLDHKGRVLGLVSFANSMMEYCVSTHEIKYFLQKGRKDPRVDSYFTNKTPNKSVSGTSRKRKPCICPMPPRMQPRKKSKTLRNSPDPLSMKQCIAYIPVSDSAWWQDLHWEMSDSTWWKEIDQVMSDDAAQTRISDGFNVSRCYTMTESHSPGVPNEVDIFTIGVTSSGEPKGHFDVDAFCSAGGFVKSMNCHPKLKWAEREDKVYLTVVLADAKDAKVNLEHEGVFTFSATAGGENNLHEIKLDLLDKVNVEESKISIGTRNIVCVIEKAEKKWWKKLLRGSGKTPHYIKGDWDKWVVEEDKGAPEMDMGGMDFSKLASMGGMDGMNFSKLGGMDVEGMGDDNDYDYDQGEVPKPEGQEGT